MHTDTELSEPTARRWPEALERGRVGDAAFARAYARTADRNRALLKTGIAAVYAACDGPMPAWRRQATACGHDLRLVREDIPLDFAVVLCGPRFTSPARLAAAVVPALCARVGEVAAVRVGAPWPEPLLTTLELCGVETVCRVGVRSLAGLWPALAAAGNGVAVLLDGVDRPARDPGDSLRFLTAKVAGRVLVADRATATFDREALAFAQPDLTLEPAPGPAALANGADSGYDALYCGEGPWEAVTGSAPLVLGPGRESCWLWPQLPPEAFRRVRLAASVIDQGA